MQVQLLEVVTIELLRIVYTKVPVSSCMYMNLSENGDVLSAISLVEDWAKAASEALETFLTRVQYTQRVLGFVYVIFMNEYNDYSFGRIPFVEFDANQEVMHVRDIFGNEFELSQDEGSFACPKNETLYACIHLAFSNISHGMSFVYKKNDHL